MSASFWVAQEEFQNHPTPETAADYWNAAVHYKEDGVIGLDTYEAAIGELIDYWRKN